MRVFIMCSGVYMSHASRNEYALIPAIKSYDMRKIRWLLQENVNLHYIDQYGDTALQAAARLPDSPSGKSIRKLIISALFLKSLACKKPGCLCQSEPENTIEMFKKNRCYKLLNRIERDSFGIECRMNKTVLQNMLSNKVPGAIISIIESFTWNTTKCRTIESDFQKKQTISALTAQECWYTSRQRLTGHKRKKPTRS